MTANTTLKLTAQEATNPDFWRELCPGLSIGADTVAPPAQLADIERQLEHHLTGRYSANHRHAMA